MVQGDIHRMDELGFHRWLLRECPPVGNTLGIGDDAAVLRCGEDVVVCTDSVAEGTHFVAGTEPQLIGRKAVARNLSDMAAMGAEPLGVLVALVLPRGCDEELAREIMRGCQRELRNTDAAIIGGDTTTHGGGIVLNVTILGRPMRERVIRRDGARPGDVLVVTGAFGGSSRGRHLAIVPRLAEARELLRLGPPSAMIDVSDGLLLDLQRLAESSRCGFELDASLLPVHADALALPGDSLERAMSDGEDFELLCAMPPEAWSRVESSWSQYVRLTRIGRVTAAGESILRNGSPWMPRSSGHVHR